MSDVLQDYADLNPFDASDYEKEEYSAGNCHTFAVALHREYGWPMLVVMDGYEKYWQDESDPDMSLPAVVHVYAIAPGDLAVDIFGTRPREAVRSECEERWNLYSYVDRELECETELSEYVGTWGQDSLGSPIERPLPEHSEEDIERAWITALRIVSIPEDRVPAVCNAQIV